jgi:hypothetical protein
MECDMDTASPAVTDDDIVESIVVELRRYKLRDLRPLDGRSIPFPQYVNEQVRRAMAVVRLKDADIPGLRNLRKKMQKIRHAAGVLAKELPQIAHTLPWTDSPKGKENAAAYRCAAEAYDLIELLCTKEPTGAEDRGPFRSITDLLLQAAGIKHNSRDICYAVLRARKRFPRNTPIETLPTPPKIV